MGKERWLKIQYVRFQKNEPEQRNTGGEMMTGFTFFG